MIMVYVCKATTLTNIVNSPEYGAAFSSCGFNFNAWKVEEVGGIPNCGSSENSAVWVLDWLERHNYFADEVVGKV
jgi:hypothetical protein